MNGPTKTTPISVADYLVGERDAEVRHEYVDGEVFAMTGASRAHNTIAINLSTAINAHVQGGPCRVASSDMKVRAGSDTRYYYPDVVVSCNDPADEPDDYTETRPTLVIEILSPSTESTDRREKRLGYQSIESLLEYVLVATERRAVERYRREDDGGWSVTHIDGEEAVALTSLSLELDIDTIYRGTTTA